MAGERRERERERLRDRDSEKGTQRDREREGGDEHSIIILPFGNERHINNDFVNLDNTKTTSLKTSTLVQWKQNIFKNIFRETDSSTLWISF